jgi:hypothetical protein
MGSQDERVKAKGGVMLQLKRIGIMKVKDTIKRNKIETDYING